MQLASILSDLTSLRVCDPAAASALVSVRPSPSLSSSTTIITTTLALHDSTTDPDLMRPHNLMHLHRTVKLAYTSRSVTNASSLNSSPAAIAELLEARGTVRKALAGLGLNLVDSNGLVEQSTVTLAISPKELVVEDDDDEEVAAWS